MRPIMILLTMLIMLTVSTTTAQNSPLSVVATTTIVADVARMIGGVRVSVTALVPPDADAHAFEPAPQDALAVEQATIVLAVGAGYETFLSALMENAVGVPVVEISRGLEMFSFVDDSGEAVALGKLGDEGVCAADHSEQGDHADGYGACDPHVWTDPMSAIVWANTIAAAFTEMDSAGAEIYRENAAAYIHALESMDEEIRQILAIVPDQRRMLVTNHEFMNYLARAYGFRVAGVVVPGGSTEGEVDPQALAALIETVKSLGVPAIFAEVSASGQIIEALAQDAGVKVVSTLSESLTDDDGAAPTYLDYLRYNASTIAEALS